MPTVNVVNLAGTGRHITNEIFALKLLLNYLYQVVIRHYAIVKQNDNFNSGYN